MMTLLAHLTIAGILLAPGLIQCAPPALRTRAIERQGPGSAQRQRSRKNGKLHSVYSGALHQSRQARHPGAEPGVAGARTAHHAGFRTLPDEPARPLWDQRPLAFLF